MRTPAHATRGFAVLVVLVMSFVLCLILTTLMTVTYALHADNRRAKAALQERADSLVLPGPGTGHTRK